MLGPRGTDTADAPVKAALELGHSQHCRELGGRVAAEARVPALQLQKARAAFCVMRAARPSCFVQLGRSISFLRERQMQRRVDRSAGY